MIAFIFYINRVFTLVFDVLCWPLGFLPLMGSMAAISLLTGVIMVWIFGKVSNQDAIRRIKDKIRANLLAIWLFRDELGVFFRVQTRLMGWTLRYMAHSFIPMLIMLVPVLFILIQLNLRYEAASLEKDQTTLLKVVFEKPEDAMAVPLSLEVSEGLDVETMPVRIPSTGEVAWRLRAVEPGIHTVTVVGPEIRLDKEVQVAASWGPVSVMRTSEFASALLYPGEALIPGDLGIRSVKLVYPSREMTILGFSVHWLVAFFVLSIAFGFMVKGFFDVEV